MSDHDKNHETLARACDGNGMMYEPREEDTAKPKLCSCCGKALAEEETRTCFDCWHDLNNDR